MKIEKYLLKFKPTIGLLELVEYKIKYLEETLKIILDMQDNDTLGEFREDRDAYLQAKIDAPIVYGLMHAKYVQSIEGLA